MTRNVDPDRRDLLKLTLAAGAVGVAAPGRAAAPTPGHALTAAEQAPLQEADPSGESPREHIADPGSDFMVEVMRAAGIRHVAVMAGSTFRGLHESIVNHGEGGPGLIVCVHEEVAAAFAHGYAKVSGEPIACLVHSNVGLQHASMAVFNAWCDRVPMVVIVGNINDATQRRPGVEWIHSNTDVATMVRDFVKWDDSPASLQHFAESFMRACDIARTPPREPVLLVCDAELQEQPIRSRAALSIPKRAVIYPAAGETNAVARAAAMLVAAERPVIVAGRMARSQRGVDMLVELAEALNAPVIDQAGRMNMPTPHHLCQTGLARTLLRDADVLLALEVSDVWGTVNALSDLSERTSSRVLPEGAKVISVSSAAALPRSNVQDVQRYFSSDILMAADAEATLPALVGAVRAAITPERRAAIAARDPELRRAKADLREADRAAAAIGWDASPISTARLSMELWKQIKTLDWALVSGTTFMSGWPQRLWDITQHHQYIGDSGGYGVGYTGPAGAGAALAHKEAGRIAVSIQGDGDMLMLPGTLWTLAHHRIPLLTVIQNNRAWHQETMHLQRMTSRRDRGGDQWRVGTVIEDPLVDFAMMARSMGVWAEGPIEQPAALPAAIRRALAEVKRGRPALLDVVTQPR